MKEISRHHVVDSQQGKKMPSTVCRIVFTDGGVTLIELIITIAIIGIIAGALGFYYQNWMGRYNIESEIKQINADLLYARSRAMGRNRAHFVRFASATSYIVYEDANPSPDGNNTLETGSDTQLPGYSKNLQHPITLDDMNNGNTIRFDRRGIATVLKSDNTIAVSSIVTSGFDPAIVITSSMSSATSENPDNDCIAIGDVGIDMGQWDVTNAKCVVK